MSFRVTPLKRSRLICLLVGLASIPLPAQVANSPVVFANVDAITTTLVQAPSMGGSGGGSSSSGDSQWLKVEFRYSVTKDAGPYLDSVEFKVWIEGRDMLDPQGKPDEGVAVVFTGTVTYINIAQGKDNYGVFYVHPSTLKRYSKLGPSDFERTFNVHVEADVDGKYADAFDKNKEKDPVWYQPLKVVPGLVFRQNQCPFIVNDPTRCPAIKLPAETAN